MDEIVMVAIEQKSASYGGNENEWVFNRLLFCGTNRGRTSVNQIGYASG